MRRSQCSPFSADPKMPQHHLQRSSRGLWTLPIKLGVHRGPWRAMVRRCGVAVTIRAQLLGRVACLRPTSRLWRTVPGLVGRSVRSLLLHVDAPGRGGRGVGGSPAGEPARAHAQCQWKGGRLNVPVRVRTETRPADQNRMAVSRMAVENRDPAGAGG